LLQQLRAELPGTYVLARGLLVAPSLDADIIVIGPAGVWVFDSKYWTGHITYSNGQWLRRKEYYESGGQLTYKEEIIAHGFDRQWIREQAAIQTTLTRDLALVGPVRGGVAFTHPKAMWTIDDSCPRDEQKEK